jgi:hypothetical protein
MATEAKVDLHQEKVDAWVITGAAMVGAKEGVQNVAENKIDLAKKLIEPGDQRNIKHPLDDLVTGAKTLASGISNTWQAATAPGDMNIDHSTARQPHPIDKTLQAHHSAIAATINMLSEKGPVEGTRAASAIAAGIVVENVVSPSGKLKAVEAIADVAQDTKALVSADKVVHREFISADEVVKAVQHAPEGFQRIKAALPQTVQDVLPMSARDLAHLMFTPQNASPIRMERFEELLKNGEDIRAVKMQHAAIPYASATIAGSTIYAANKVVTYANSEESHYESYADRFMSHATQEYKQQENLEQLKSTIPAMAKPIDKFLEMRAGLEKDGSLSEQDRKTLTHVAESFSNLIKTEGPDSKNFDSVHGAPELSR